MNLLSMNQKNCVEKIKDLEFELNLIKLERIIEKPNLIVHVFIVVEEEIKNLEPSSYVEETSCKDVAKSGLDMMEDMGLS